MENTLFDNLDNTQIADKIDFRKLQEQFQYRKEKTLVSVTDNKIYCTEDHNLFLGETQPNTKDFETGALC